MTCVPARLGWLSRVTDTRTKRQKLQEMADKGTEHEAAVARSKLASMSPEPVMAAPVRVAPVGQRPPPTAEQMRTVFQQASPFGQAPGGADLYFNGVKVGRTDGYTFSLGDDGLFKHSTPEPIDDAATIAHYQEVADGYEAQSRKARDDGFDKAAKMYRQLRQNSLNKMKAAKRREKHRG